MKVYLSADIEGTAGITTWPEAEMHDPNYPEHREKMTREVLAACDGAIAAGAKDILIKDAHDTGRNILQKDLPECARLIRGWSGHPFSMVQEIDATFDAAMLLGYHSKAGDETNPLAHTLTLRIMRMHLNGEPTSEFLLQTYAAAYVGVPVVFVSGDKQLCADAKAINPGIVAVPVSEGRGPSTISLAPKASCKRIKEGVEKALNGNLRKSLVKLPKRFTLEVEYSNPVNAYKASWYPGAKHIGNRKVRFETRDYFEVARALKFIA
ncbi:MAG TPA: M55 family metallopeptidase [Alphaproteobacteria bacterium]|nr:M55 family metallopeptidase [Alphaproteobacteria bacterium]